MQITFIAWAQANIRLKVTIMGHGVMFSKINLSCLRSKCLALAVS